MRYAEKHNGSYRTALGGIANMESQDEPLLHSVKYNTHNVLYLTPTHDCNMIITVLSSSFICGVMSIDWYPSYLIPWPHQLIQQGFTAGKYNCALLEVIAAVMQIPLLELKLLAWNHAQGILLTK